LVGKGTSTGETSWIQTKEAVEENYEGGVFEETSHHGSQPFLGIY